MSATPRARTKKRQQCGCLGAPFRALSRACNAACDLYVRGMSGAARRVPSGAADAVGRGGYARSPTASPMIVRVSSDRVEDLVRAAAGARPNKQGRRVAPAGAEVVDLTVKTKGAGPRQGRRVAPAQVNDVKTSPISAAAGMETIAEDAPCEYGASALPPPSSRRRGAAARGGLTTRSGEFGAAMSGRRQVFVR